MLARVVPPDRMVHLTLAPVDQGRAWIATGDRRPFLELVAGVTAVADPVGRFLALDADLARRAERALGLGRAGTLGLALSLSRCYHRRPCQTASAST